MLFYKEGFGIKEPTKVDMPLNKEIKPNNSGQKSGNVSSLKE